MGPFMERADPGMAYAGRIKLLELQLKTVVQRYREVRAERDALRAELEMLKRKEPESSDV